MKCIAALYVEPSFHSANIKQNLSGSLSLIPRIYRQFIYKIEHMLSLVINAPARVLEIIEDESKDITMRCDQQKYYRSCSTQQQIHGVELRWSV